MATSTGGWSARSARPSTNTSAALCIHKPMASDAKRFADEHERKMETGTLALYVGEYDEHSVREVMLSPADVRSGKAVAAFSGRNILATFVRRGTGGT